MKQKKALEAYMANGMTDKKAAVLEAGYAPTTAPASVIDPLLSRRPIVRALRKKEITDEKIAQVIADGLEAKRVHSTEAGITETEIPDHHVRGVFVKEANKLLDNYPAVKVQRDERVVNINLTGEDMKALQNFMVLREPDGKSESSR